MLHKLRRFEEGGQAPDPMQILQAYAQANQMDEETFGQFMQEFQSMPPQEQQHVLQIISQQLQQMQQQTPQQGMQMGEEAQMEQQPGNPMVAQLGARIGDAIYDPIFKSYSYNLPKAEYGYEGIDPSQYPVIAPPRKKMTNTTKQKQVVSPPAPSNSNDDLSDIEQRANAFQPSGKPSIDLKPKDSYNLAEILNNDAINYKKIEKRNNQGFEYEITNEKERQFSFNGSVGMEIDVPVYAKKPIKPQGLFKLKSDSLTSIYTYNNGDSIVLDPESSQFVKRNNKTGKYQPVTELDMQTAYNLGLPKSKKLIEKYHGRS